MVIHQRSKKASGARGIPKKISRRNTRTRCKTSAHRVAARKKRVAIIAQKNRNPGKAVTHDAVSKDTSSASESSELPFSNESKNKKIRPDAFAKARTDAE